LLQLLCMKDDIERETDQMKVITAVEDFIPAENDIKVFLAGGITNCPDWQSEVITNFMTYDAKFKGELDDLVLFNTRRPNFPIDDPNASNEQIAWEFKWLQEMDIFSMYFTAGESDQPICMYELGRNLMRMQCMHGTDFDDRIVISCDPGYRRSTDVKIQLNLMWNAYFGQRTGKHHAPDFIEKADPLEHMYHIIRSYKITRNRMRVVKNLEGGELEAMLKGI